MKQDANIALLFYMLENVHNKTSKHNKTLRTFIFFKCPLLTKTCGLFSRRTNQGIKNQIQKRGSDEVNFHSSDSM